MKQFAVPLAGLALLVGACATQSDMDADVGTTGGTVTVGERDGDRDRDVRRGAEREDVTATAVGEPRPGTQADLATNIGDRVFFGFDRHDLDSESRQLVQDWANWLEQYPAIDARIEGHTDERGTREYNLALGARRAQAVKDYLITLGVGSDRLSTVSYGQESPAVLGSNEEAWALNRRAVLAVN